MHSLHTQRENIGRNVSWQDRPKIASSRRLNLHFFQKVNFQKNERHRGREHDFEPKTVPKTTQDRPKTAPRRSSRGVCFASIFIFDFGQSWVRFWLPKGCPEGAKIGHFWHRFFIDFCMSFQDRPKSGQERPRSPPRAPKSGPRAAQERPREPQEGQKVTQEAPRHPRRERKENEGRASEAGSRKESEKIKRAMQAKQAAEKRAKR